MPDEFDFEVGQADPNVPEEARVRWAAFNPEREMEAVEPEPWEPPKIMDTVDVEAEEGDDSFLRLKLFQHKGETPNISILNVWNDDQFEEEMFHMSIAEAIRLHKVLGKVLEDGTTNT